MRTLQEKYNGINEGAFSKEQFLRDARLQLPNLITQYNGYEDAVKILKNRGIVQEEFETPKEYKASKFKDGQKLKNTLSGAFYTVDGKDETGGIYVRTEKGLRKQIPSKHFDAYEIVNEARLTNKSLTDYRYKPTNDLDKYPYEQILRGLRVELEGMQVTGTPTAEDYKKALAKVLKNLQKDEIFYTNQIAGVNKKVDNHDQMVDVQGKEKEIKNSVDTFNGLKKAALKEGFKKLIKKVLTENADPLRDYMESKGDKKPVNEVASNDPKIEKLVQGINSLISQAKDSDGDPIGVIWPGGTWDEPYVYQPVVYKNGQLKVTSQSLYGGDPETETVLSRNMQLDGLPMLKTLMRMYKKAIKDSTKSISENQQSTETGVDVTGASNASGEYEIMMHMLDAGITNRSEASEFFSLNYSDMPEQQIEFLINHYFQEFQDEEGKDTQVDENDVADDVPHPRGYEEASDEESFEDLLESVSLKDIL